MAGWKKSREPACEEGPASLMAAAESDLVERSATEDFEEGT
jgi:hypothetical protein